MRSRSVQTDLEMTFVYRVRNEVGGNSAIIEQSVALCRRAITGDRLPITFQSLKQAKNIAAVGVDIGGQSLIARKIAHPCATLLFYHGLELCRTRFVSLSQPGVHAQRAAVHRQTINAYGTESRGLA